MDFFGIDPSSWTFWDHYWPHIVFFGGLALGVPAAVHAAMNKDDVRAAIGWVGVVILSPVFGAILYFLAGINRVRRSVVSRQRARAEARDVSDGRSHLHEEASAGPEEMAWASLKRLGDVISPFPLTGGNDIRPLRGGDEAYPAMLEAIAGAKRSIALASYIFDNDEVGRTFVDALTAASKRGVAVRVLIDAIGARYSHPPITHLLRERGIKTALFMSHVLGLGLAYANLRSHRKMLIVDGRLGFTGGMNIRAEFTTAAAGAGAARDTHFRIEGPIVPQIMSTFAIDWSFTTKERLDGEIWFPGGIRSAEGHARVRAVPSGPDRNLENNHGMIMGALAVAQERVRIASPYFLPDQQLIGALAVAGRRGLQVDIVIPDANNLKLVDHAMTAQLDQVIRRGCKVWRATGPFDHSKLIAIDGRWAYVGSSNVDPRSLRLNFELDLEIHDRTVAGWVEKRIEEQIANARAETLQTLSGRPFWQRLRNRMVWLASPYL